MTNKQNPSFSRKDLALVTFGHCIASQLRVFFCKLHITINNSISCKYWVSTSSKSLIITQLGQFRPQHTTITGFRLRVPNKMQVLDFQTLAFFFFPFAPRLHHRSSANFRISSGYRVHFYREMALGPLFFQGIKSSFAMFLHSVDSDWWGVQPTPGTETSYSFWLCIFAQEQIILPHGNHRCI